MTEEERDIKLEELFRSKLDDAEMEPGTGLTSHFMRRLARREFVRFNPARFNIFYLAAAAAAAATVAGMLILSPGRDSSNGSATGTEIPPAGVTIHTEKAAESVTGPEKTPEVQVPAVTYRGTASHSGQKTEVPSNRHDEKVMAVQGVSEKIPLTDNKAGEAPMGAVLPRAVIDASAASGCVPLRVTFRNTGTGIYESEWSFGDGGRYAGNEAEYIYDIPGTYNVTLTVSDSEGRSSVASTSITVWPGPKAAFEIRETDVSITDDHVLFTNLSTGATEYLWDFGDGTSSGAYQPSHRYEEFGTYNVSLIAFTEYGCADSVTITDAFTDKGLFLRFPTAFMPGTGGPTGGYYSQRTDESNQVFHPVTSGVMTYNLKIFSKQGMLVFESNDINMGWDGYYKGELCSPGVYLWKVRGTFRNGQPIVMSGDVTLLNY